MCAAAFDPKDLDTASQPPARSPAEIPRDFGSGFPPFPEDRPSDRILDRLMALHPKVIDLGLDRTLDLLEKLNRPQDRLPPVVHVAGTNGKGSTIAFLRAIAEAAGLAPHVYTSPHLVRFNERIRLAGNIISELDLANLLEHCENVNGGTPITFFEITTCAAFKAFAETPGDLLLLEVGLGGRMDSTNVVDKPAATVITPVSMDHTQFLGNSLREIASEKAAIQKRDTPTIIGRQDPAAMAEITAVAEAHGIPMAREGVEWSATPNPNGGFVFQSPIWSGDLPKPGLLGAHQVDNAGIAIATALVLADQGFPITPKDICAGIANAVWSARMQRLSIGPILEHVPGAEVWLDGGHNAAAGDIIAQQASDWKAEDDRPLHLICGMLNTKSAVDFLSPLAPFAASLQTIAIPGEANSFTADELAETARKAGVRHVSPHGSLAEATAAIRKTSAKSNGGNARIVICGSLYLAGRILAHHG